MGDTPLPSGTCDVAGRRRSLHGAPTGAAYRQERRAADAACPNSSQLSKHIRFSETGAIFRFLMECRGLLALQMGDGWRLHTFAAISLSDQALLSIGSYDFLHIAAPSGFHAAGTPPTFGLPHDRHTAVPTGFHATGMPLSLRAFTRPAHRCPYGLSRDRHTAVPTDFHATGTPLSLRAFTNRGRSRPWPRSRPKDSPGIQSIQPTHWLWLHRGTPPLSCGLFNVYYQASPSASIAAKGGSYPGL